MEKIEYEENEIEKSRHGCVSVWLILMMIANSLTGLVYLLLPENISKLLPGEVSALFFVLLGVIGFSNVVFSVALYRWKLWGFYGFIVSSLLTFVINVYIGLGAGQSLFGLAGIAILYGILQIKKDNVSAWNYME
ncbi:MAG: hypothetical protein ACOVP1_04590 [Bacteroidia bacterium]